MANAWTPRDVKLGSLKPITADGAYVASKAYPVTAGGARFTKVAVKLSGSNATGTININLQTAMADIDSEYVEVANVDTITNADGWHYLDFFATSTLLADVGRVEVDAVGGAQFTVDQVKILQAD